MKNKQMQIANWNKIQVLLLCCLEKLVKLLTNPKIKLIILLTMLILSCSKTKNCGVDGNWTLYKKVNNRTGETIIYPDDSCFRYIISNNKAKVFKHTNISDSLIIYFSKLKIVFNMDTFGIL